jgi:hypothetical protein
VWGGEEWGGNVTLSRGGLRGNVEGVVQILQLREGCVTGRYTYSVLVPTVTGSGEGVGGEGRKEEGGAEEVGEAEVAEALQRVLQRHYLSAQPSDVPHVLLTQVRSRILVA